MDVIGLDPTRGLSSGNVLVRFTGHDFTESVRIRFGNAEPIVLYSRMDGGFSVADVPTPTHELGVVDVTVQNLDESGQPIPGDEVILPEAFQFFGERFLDETNLTRLVRKLLTELKKQILEMASISVSVDYDDTSDDRLDIIAMSKLPSVMLTGPRLDENRFYTRNEERELKRLGLSGEEIVLHGTSFTVDLTFTITAASKRTTELLNIMSAVVNFLSRNKWISLVRDPDSSDGETVKWEMDMVGDLRTNLDGPDDVRAFSCSFVVRGFDVDEGAPVGVTVPVSAVEIDVEGCS